MAKKIDDKFPAYEPGPKPTNTNLLQTGKMANKLVTLRKSLIANTDGFEAYNRAASRVNAPNIPIAKFNAMAERFLTEKRLDAAHDLLPGDNTRKLVIARFNIPVSHEGIISLWESATEHSGGNLSEWGQRLDYLKLWDANSLSGFDPNFVPEFEGDFPLAITSLDDDYMGDGSLGTQNDRYKKLCRDFPAINICIATLGDGAILGHRFEKENNLPKSYKEKQVYVRLTHLGEKDFSGRVTVPSGEIYRSGIVDVGGSLLDYNRAPKLLLC